MMSQEFGEWCVPIVTGIISSSIFASISYLIYFCHKQYVKRIDKWFWDNFYKKNINIIFREYKIDVSTAEEEIANSIGDGYQVSKGMALSIGRLVSYLQHGVTSNNQIKTQGDQTNTFDVNTEVPICLGSKNNIMTKTILDRVSAVFSFPFDTGWDNEEKRICITHKTEKYTPNIKDGNGTDYALIVNVLLDSGPVLIIAGAHMWGTQGAVEAITNKHWLKEIRKRFLGKKNIALVLKFEINENRPHVREIIQAVQLGRIL